MKGRNRFVVEKEDDGIDVQKCRYTRRSSTILCSFLLALTESRQSQSKYSAWEKRVERCRGRGKEGVRQGICPK